MDAMEVEIPRIPMPESTRQSSPLSPRAQCLDAPPSSPRVRSSAHGLSTRYKFIKTLGEGAFSKVKLATHVHSGKEVPLPLS